MANLNNGVVVNSVDSKEVVIMNDVNSIKDRLMVAGIHSEGYLGKVEIGDILGLSKRTVARATRAQLIEMLEAEISKEDKKKIKKSSKASKSQNKASKPSKKEEVTVKAPKTVDNESKASKSQNKASKPSKKEEVTVKAPKTVDNESKASKSTSKTSENMAKTIELYNKLNKIALDNEQKGYGRTITVFMLTAVILEGYGIYNLKGAMRNDELTRKSGKGRIILTEELHQKFLTIKDWLIKHGKIAPVIYKADNNKNYYIANVYDGKYAKSMTELTQEIYPYLHDVKCIAYRVY